MNEASPACRIFVVDTFWRVIVHYADSAVTLAAGEAAGEEPLPFPPSRDSAIGQYLELRRAVRPTAGQEVVYSRPGTPEVREMLVHSCRILRFHVCYTNKCAVYRSLFWSCRPCTFPSPATSLLWLSLVGRGARRCGACGTLRGSYA